MRAKPETRRMVEKSGSIEGSVLDEILKRINAALAENPHLRPETWNDVLKGLELVMKFRDKGDELVEEEELEKALEKLEERLGVTFNDQ